LAALRSNPLGFRHHRLNTDLFLWNRRPPFSTRSATTALCACLLTRSPSNDIHRFTAYIGASERLTVGIEHRNVALHQRMAVTTYVGTTVV
jgi:hypothetical protein